MAYTTEAIVRAQSPFKNTTNIESAYITRKITEADSIIDSIIGEAYVLPLESTPAIIQSISSAIVSVLLFREQNTNIEVEPGVNIEDIWKAQFDLLELIRTRKLKLFSSGVELPLTDKIKPSFYPNQSSSDATDYTNTSPKVTMNKTF